MSYNPQIPPQDDKELLPFLSDELNRVAISYNDLQDGFWGVAHGLPLRIRPGIIKIFDGTDANPLGTGRAGVYYYGEDNQWHFLTDSQAVIDIITPILDDFSIAIIDAVVDAIDAALVTARPTLLTPAATTSGSVVPLTPIPTWANRVHVVLDRVSTTGTNSVGAILVTGSGGVGSGYTGSTSVLSTTVSTLAHSSNIVLANSLGAATDTLSGSLTLVRVSGNTWSYTVTTSLQTGRTFSGAGSIVLSEDLLGVALATADTFDSGQFNIVYD